MASIFNSLDHKLNPAPAFWQKLDPRSPEDLITAVVFSGELKLKINNNLYKTRKCVLTKTHLYYLSKWNLPKYKVKINWKVLEPFCEDIENMSSYGFRLGDSVFQDFYTKSRKELDLWISHLSSATILTSFEDDYIVIKPLYRGKNSCVLLAQSIDTNEEFALKVFYKDDLKDKAFLMQQILNEIQALKMLDSQKIVKLHRVYETKKNVYLLLDYFPDGDLYHYLNTVKKISEPEVVRIIGEVLKALNFVHTMGFMHRDIKAENIAVYKENNQIQIKLIDFGLACEHFPELNQKCGSPGYMAPELLDGKKYSFKADLFSTGALMYKLLCGKSLFAGKNTQDILEKNRKCLISFGNSTLKKVSKSTLELLKSLLEVNPLFRCSASEALTYATVSQSKSYEIVNNSVETTPDTLSEAHKQEKFFVYKRQPIHCKLVL